MKNDTKFSIAFSVLFFGGFVVGAVTAPIWLPVAVYSKLTEKGPRGWYRKNFGYSFIF